MSYLHAQAADFTVVTVDSMVVGAVETPVMTGSLTPRADALHLKWHLDRSIQPAAGLDRVCCTVV